MPIDEAREFIAAMPWRAVRGRPEGPLNKQPEPHEYLILSWYEVPAESFWRFVNLIRATGHLGRYTAPYNGRSMVNRYLEIDGFDFWALPPQVCRARSDHRQHTRLPEQISLEVDR
jgi:hypothetical protein